MRLLLDTHIAFWAVAGSRQLPRATATLIEDRDNEVAVSIASLWEIGIKNSLGRAATDPFRLSVEDAQAAFEQASFAVLPIEVRHVREVKRLPRRHGDPFDRLLVATALADTYRLITHDRHLAAYGDAVLLV